MKLFNEGKTGLFLDSITHKTEKRRDGETKVIALGCRVVPFTVQHAQAIDDVVRGSLFSRNGNAEPRQHVVGLDFALPIERQDVDIYASPDTTRPTIRLQQVKVSNLRAQIEKWSNSFVLKVRLTFGPASDKELAFVESWRQTQRFLTFTESAPDLAYSEVGNVSEDPDDEEGEQQQQPALEEVTDAPTVAH